MPGLPGAILVFFGVLAHKLILPGAYSWWVVGIIFILALAFGVSIFFAGVAGAKWGGASKSGMVGAAIGGFVGVFWGPPGWLLGPFLGAILGDIYAQRRKLSQLMRSGAGAALGFIVALILCLALLLTQVVVILFALVF